MDHQPTVQALDPDHTAPQPPRAKVEEWNGVATSLPFNVQPPAQAVETETVETQAPPPPSSVMVEPPRSPLGTASVAPSTKRNSPDEGSMDEREVKRVRAESSTPMGPPAIPSPAPSLPVPPAEPVDTKMASPPTPAEPSPAPPAEQAASVAIPAPVETPVPAAAPVDTPVAAETSAPADPIPAPAPVPTPGPVPVEAPAPVAPALKPEPLPSASVPTPAPAPAAYPPAPYQQAPPQVLAPGQTFVVPSAYVPPPPKPAGPTTPLTVTQHKHLIGIVRALKRSKDAFAFVLPVDPVALNIPHYTQIVTRPMDLGTVETKLVVSNPNGQPKDKSKMKNWDFSKGSYRSVSEVVMDVRQIWENTRMFNGPDHVVSQAATRLDDMFEKSLEKLPSEPAYGYASSPAAPSPSEHYASTSQQVRRPSISHPPTIRRNSQGPDASRPKREIHPPPPKDLMYNDGPQGKKKRKSDAQLNYVSKAISDLMNKKQYWEAALPFLAPVDPVALGIPEYNRIIKRPMDMGTIKAKLAEGEYTEPGQVNEDMKLMFNNCYTFNPPNTPVHMAGKQLQQFWTEKWRNLPPKVEPRNESDYDDDSEEDDDVTDSIRMLEQQVAEIQRSIAKLREKKAQRKAARAASRGHPYKQAKAARPGPSKPRQSNGHSPANGSGRKAKSSGIVYRDDDGVEDFESEDDSQQVTLNQKQALAERIQEADPDTLAKAIKIIQETTALGNNDDEIELDIDALPAATVLKLYNLVVRGPRKLQSGRPKSQAALVQGKKPGRKGTGGLARKSMNELEEAERIRKMEDQLASFDNPQPVQQDVDSDESSDEESDED